jgi:catechol 2,3-dioxygenase-like lactoylglutathione lyase family enzyme
MAISHLAAVGVDCADPLALANFYTRLTGWKVAFSSDHFVAVDGGSLWLTFHRVADYRAPTWPTSHVPKQLHLDFEVDDLDAAQADAIESGAVIADVQPRPEAWRVLLDPEGHPFCLCMPLSR